MRYFNYIGFFCAALVIGACFLPWVIIEGPGLTISGFVTTGTNFGKPGLMNAMVCSISLLLFLIPKVWAKRANLFFSAFNLSWAIRNFILITLCHGGECPVKQFGIYLYMAAALLQMVMAAFPHLPLKENKKTVHP